MIQEPSPLECISLVINPQLGRFLIPFSPGTRSLSRIPTLAQVMVRRYSAPLPASSGAQPVETLHIYELKYKIIVIAEVQHRHGYHRHWDDRRHCILAIDRKLHRQLEFEEDPREYTADECRVQIDRLIADGGGTIAKPVTAFGILGFICLVESYHMAIVARRRSVGRILGHEIFAVEQVQYIQIFAGEMSEEARKTEGRYAKFLADSHLTSPCFFSYTYDLTSTLQSNMGGSPAPFKGIHGVQGDRGVQEGGGGGIGGRDMFCWNRHLLQGGGFYRKLHNKHWALVLISGFFEQRAVALTGAPGCGGDSVDVTLIARRSRHLAGTRFLKRGVSSAGFVANHVETEHILNDSGLGRELVDMMHSAYVQVRGSVPLFWSQTSDGMSPKPDVTLEHTDPLFTATRRHLTGLVTSYGVPLLVLDLLKIREKKPRESRLASEMAEAMRCLCNSACASVCDIEASAPCGGLGATNRFFARASLPSVEDSGARAGARAGAKASLVQWDFAQEKKAEKERAGTSFEARLVSLCANLVKRTGFFLSRCQARSGKDMLADVGGWTHAGGREQRGVVRSNCLDCLDRTNSAQLHMAQVCVCVCV